MGRLQRQLLSFSLVSLSGLRLMDCLELYISNFRGAWCIFVFFILFLTDIRLCK